MIENLIIYENKRVDDIYPFNIMHCSWELRTGIYLNYERIIRISGCKNTYFIGRELQLKSFINKFKINNLPKSNKLSNTLFIDGAISLTSDNYNTIWQSTDSNKNVIYMHNDTIIGYYCKTIDFDVLNYYNLIDQLSPLIINSNKIEIKDIQITNYLWDTLNNIESMINEDIKLAKNHNLFYAPAYHNVFAIAPNNIYIGNNVKIAPSVYIDASSGPIVIDDNVVIMGLAGLIGPMYIGKNTFIKMGAKIYENNLIGNWCKVGGEVENSIFQSYSNKQHDGYLGHSYIGEWVNLGADTNNSDLKNTYSKIKMRLPHKTIQTEKTMLGLMCGDHTKSAINTQFNTGTVIGISSIIFDSGFLPTTIPSFTYGGNSNSKKYNIDQAIETAKIMMNRRKVKMSDEEIAIMKHYFNNEQ